VRPSPSSKRQRPIALVLAVALATAPFASALAGPAEDKATARELAKEGIAAEKKGDCNVAIDRLERAESLFHAPPHLQYLARCYVKVGRLVDAAETWRKLTLEPLAPNAPPAFKDAVAEASAELPKVEPRLARLTVKTTQSYDGLVVEVDGKKWPTAALDVPRVIDPGKHTVRARATGFKTSEAKVEVGEGKSDSVTLTLEPGTDPGPAPSASVTPTATATTTATAVPTTTATASRPGKNPTFLTIGWIATGIGLVAIGGGVFTGVSGNGKYDELKRDCPVASSCSLPDLEQKKSDIRRLETATNLLLIGGGALVLTGISLVIFAPSKKSDTSAISLQFAPTASGGHVALTGSF